MQLAASALLPALSDVAVREILASKLPDSRFAYTVTRSIPPDSTAASSFAPRPTSRASWPRRTAGTRQVVADVLRVLAGRPAALPVLRGGNRRRAQPSPVGMPGRGIHPYARGAGARVRPASGWRPYTTGHRRGSSGRPARRSAAGSPRRCARARCACGGAEQHGRDRQYARELEHVRHPPEAPQNTPGRGSYGIVAAQSHAPRT
jgi:hypothetical protein